MAAMAAILDVAAGPFSIGMYFQTSPTNSPSLKRIEAEMQSLEGNVVFKMAAVAPILDVAAGPFSIGMYFQMSPTNSSSLKRIEAEMQSLEG